MTNREILGKLDNWRKNTDVFSMRLQVLDSVPLVDRLNVDLAESVVTFLRHHGVGHEQKMWLAPSDQGYLLIEDGPADPLELVQCGTTACLAGWSVVFDRARIKLNNIMEFPRVILSVDALIGSSEYAWNQVSFIDYAQQALGLNADEVDWLFYMCADTAKGITAEERTLTALTGAINTVKSARG